MKTEPCEFPLRNHVIHARSGICEELRTAGLNDLDSLSSRRMGRVISDRRSSWVRSYRIRTIDVYVKTYDYPTPSDRRRGIGRTTLFAASRAVREWNALQWFTAEGFSAVEPLLVAERRRFGFLRRAVIMTRAWAGEPADRALANLPTAQAVALIRAIETAVHAWHAAGFRDRNLDLRNLLVRRSAANRQSEEWEVVKIDSPRHRLRHHGRSDDRLACADRDRLWRSIAELGRDDLSRDHFALDA